MKISVLQDTTGLNVLAPLLEYHSHLLVQNLLQVEVVVVDGIFQGQAKVAHLGHNAVSPAGLHVLNYDCQFVLGFGEVKNSFRSHFSTDDIFSFRVEFFLLYENISRS